MKNTQVIEIFAKGHNEAKTKNLFIENGVIYSYGYHFPLSVMLKDGYIINSDSYSSTTSQHKGHLIRELTNNVRMTFKQFEKEKSEHTNLILMNTDEIKLLINDFGTDLNNMTIEDLQKEEILNELEKE